MLNRLTLMSNGSCFPAFPAAGQVIPGKTICIIKLLLSVFAPANVNRIIIIILAFLSEPIPRSQSHPICMPVQAKAKAEGEAKCHQLTNGSSCGISAAAECSTSAPDATSATCVAESQESQSPPRFMAGSTPYRQGTILTIL